MIRIPNLPRALVSVVLGTILLGGCVATTPTQAGLATAISLVPSRNAELFAQDRQAILSMQGEYAVTFDFRETVAIAPGYELADPKITPARELVIVVEDSGEFIMLQHLLIAGSDENPIIVKHWRQDWRYQPARLLAFTGHDNWEMRNLDAAIYAGSWSQTVYQVDDSPRYAAIARWQHDGVASTWEPAVSLRPLPRRDDTTRDDYDAISAVNRHTITNTGWIHEQDNSKIALREGEVRELVREVGVNTYTRTDLARDDAALSYWDATSDYWARVRQAFLDLEYSADAFHIEDDAEGSLLYGPLLDTSQRIVFGLSDLDSAWEEAQLLLESQVTIID